MLMDEKRRVWLLVACFVLVIVGCGLTVEMTQSLIATTLLTEWAWRITFALGGILLLGFWCVPSWHSRLNAALEHRMPTHILRVLLGFPLMSWGFAGILVAAPLGYAYGVAYLTGSVKAGVVAFVVEAEPRRSSGKGCKQHLKLRLEAAVSKVCVDDMLVGPMPDRGQRVELRGVRSYFGFWVQKVNSAAEQAPR
jgi:hypothetical protein